MQQAAGRAKAALVQLGIASHHSQSSGPMFFFQRLQESISKYLCFVALNELARVYSSLVISNGHVLRDKNPAYIFTVTYNERPHQIVTDSWWAILIQFSVFFLNLISSWVLLFEAGGGSCHWRQQAADSNLNECTSEAVRLIVTRSFSVEGEVSICFNRIVVQAMELLLCMLKVLHITCD